MPLIFISYRRSDSATFVGRIRERLASQFGDSSVYRDIDSIPIAADFYADIERAVIACDAILVVIGPDWLNATDKDGKLRFDNPKDFVRIEIELALRQRKGIFPIRINDTPMPEPKAPLPPELWGLCYLNAPPVRDDPDFDHDMQRLIAAIKERFPPPPPPEPTPSPPPETITPLSEPSLPARKRRTCVIQIIIAVTLGALAILSALVIAANPPPETPTPSVAPSETPTSTYTPSPMLTPQPSPTDAPTPSSTLTPAPTSDSTIMLFDFENCESSTGWYWDRNLGAMGEPIICSDERESSSHAALRIEVPFAGNRGDEAVGVYSLIPGTQNIPVNWSGSTALIFEIASPDDLPPTCRVQPFIKYRQGGGLVWVNDAGHEMNAGEWTTIHSYFRDYVDDRGYSVVVDLTQIDTVGLKVYCRPSETAFRGIFYIDNIRLEG